jgi:hypothetical protein
MFNNYNGKYLIIDNKYVGKVINELWNNNCVLIKLENYMDYIDVILKRNKDLKIIDQSILEDNKGYLIATNNMKVQIINNGESIKKAIELMKNNKLNDIQGKIHIEYNNFLSNIRTTTVNINTILQSKISAIDKKENKELDYITKLMKKIINNEKIMYSAQYNIGKNIDEADEESVENIKKILIKNLIEQESFDMDYYSELDKSLSYKDLIDDKNIDNISFGTEIINIIIENLYNFSLKIKSDGKIITKNGEDINLFEEYSIFNFLKFQIIGDYIEITDITKENRKITEELIPDLIYLKTQQYDKEINYEQLLSLLMSINETNITQNNDLIKEILKVLSQEYTIGLQPKINFLIWTIVRLIVCWYADDEMRKKIFKIKILINTFRSRSDKNYNIINGIEPLITVHPEYGKDNTYKILAYLNLYFFKYKNFGNRKDKPTFYKNIDEDSLLYYINSSTDVKKYVKYMKEKKISNKIFNDKINNTENNIEISINENNNINEIDDKTQISTFIEQKVTKHDILN